MSKRVRAVQPTRTTDYHEYRELVATLGSAEYRFVSKPGVPSWNEVDDDTRLLAGAARVAGGQSILCYGAGAGLLGVILATHMPDAEILLLDGSIVSTRACERTLSLNRLSRASARISDALAAVLDQQFDQVLIDMPKGKALVQQLILDAWRVLRLGGTLLLAGGNREGIKTYAQMVGAVFGNQAVTGLGGGHRVITARKQSEEMPATAPASCSPGYYDYVQYPVTVGRHTLTIVSKPGVFSWDELDGGTRMLLDHMVVNPTDTVLDLGCGNGAIGAFAARLAPAGTTYLVDAQMAAIHAAQRTLQANDIANAQVRLSDVASDVYDVRFDVVLTNLPFHLGIETEHEVAAQFIRDALAVLNDRGRLCLVANRFLTYETLLNEIFGHFRVVYSDNRYKVLEAQKGSA